MAAPISRAVLSTSRLPATLTRSSLDLLLPSCVVVKQERHIRYNDFRVRPPARMPWWVRKWSLKKDEKLTPENEEFIRDVIVNKYTCTDPSPLKDAPWERNPYTRGTRRGGVLALKLGVMKQWTKDGRGFHVTLLQVLDNHVINYVPPEVYASYPSHQPHQGEKFGLQVVGALSCDPRKFSKEYNNLFMKAGVPPKRWLTRFLVTPNAAIQPGTALNVNHFRVGDFVDVQGRTRDYGFQGVVKRHGMKGLPASHGVTKSHRKMGSTGGGGDKDGIWKGKRMPGIFGDRMSKSLGLRIWRINTKYNILFVHGTSVPGLPHTFIRVYDSLLSTKRIKEETADTLPMPTWYPEDVAEDDEPLPEDLYHDSVFQMSQPSVEVTTDLLS